MVTRSQKPSTTGSEWSSVHGLNNDTKQSLESGTKAGTIAPRGSEDAVHHGRSRKRKRSPSPAASLSAPSGNPKDLKRATGSGAKATATADEKAELSHEKVAHTPTRRGRRAAVQGTSGLASAGRGSNNHGAPGQVTTALQQPARAEASGEITEGDDLVPTSPDMDIVMREIIDHRDTVDNQYALHDDALGSADADPVLPQSASSRLKVQSLPILDNLAVQVLATFAHSSYQETLALTSDASTEPGAAYSTLKSLFDHTRKVYSNGDPFLSSQELGFHKKEEMEIIRKANLATFVSSVFGSQDVGFYHLNEFFLDTFVADGSRLLKNQAGLFLDLKTQAYISAIASGERSREDILQDLFPDDMEHSILNQRGGGKQLSPGEADFIQRASNRKKTLSEEPMTAESIAQLPEKYVWEDFLRDISSYVSKNFPTIGGASGRKISSQQRSTHSVETDGGQQSKRQLLRKPPQEAPQQEAGTAPSIPNTFTPRVAQMVPTDTDDIIGKAARAAADLAMQDFSVNQVPTGPPSINRQDRDQTPAQQQPQQYPFHFEQQPAPYYTQNQFSSGPQLQPQLQQQPVDMAQAQNMYMSTPPVPYPTQSAPTSVLYERARMAATAKASPSARRAGHPSQRRPWSQDEENALMHGLDHVKGPHWSQILAMYGPGGSVNETLKDRNQVQLKDKARNLKLFFLKSGIEVPYYLQFVTGELKTRAPQAARMAEEREVAAARQGEAVSRQLEGALHNDGGQAAGGAGDGGMGHHDTNTEDGEGEMIDPAEYADVHGTDEHGMGGGGGGGGRRDSQDTVYIDAQQQLSQAAAQAAGP